jgi:homoserine dehydrogenase
VRIALLGYGNVARAFFSFQNSNAERLRREYGLELKICLAANSKGYLDLTRIDAELTVAPAEAWEPADWHQDPALFARHCIDAGVQTVIETLPNNLQDGEPALSLDLAIVRAGLNLVTVNKGPLVHGCERLSAACIRQHQIAYRAATGGALPTSSFALQELPPARVTRIRGILNGTTNYILSRMFQRKQSLEFALQEAQSLGIAEPDPSFDLDGWDTACKLLIISNAVVGARLKLSDVEVVGIRGVAATGSNYKLFARAEYSESRWKLHVRPEPVRPYDPFYFVNGTEKAIEFETDILGTFFLRGGISGREPIAATIVKDLLHMGNLE